MIKAISLNLLTGFFALICGLYHHVSVAQNAKISTESRPLITYPFSDPSPIPALAYNPTLYPYFQFDGFSHEGEAKQWKVVTLENDHITVTVLPEIGGKVWGAIEKESGYDFIYFNEVVKFRNIASRGPWTSGGIEFNFGIIGHSPATATPVDYILQENADGSVTCVVGTMDLPSRTQWRVKINLPKDKAYFETQGFWYNPQPTHNSYYNWMTAAAHVGEDLEFFYPGDIALQHSGQALPWPIDEEGNELSWYRNNAFGGSKSQHMAGSFNNFFGGYFHDKNIGFGHWAPFDAMPGKKLWIWALSRSGGIWEDLLTDENGQYMEFQAGRLMNQFSPSQSQPTPLTKVGFGPYYADQWEEIWFPVKGTGGLSAASKLGTIYLEEAKDHILIHFNALQEIKEKLQIKVDGQTIHEFPLSMQPLEVFTRRVDPFTGKGKVEVLIGGHVIFMTGEKDPYNLSRPFTKDKVFALSEVEALYQEARQSFFTRNYKESQEFYEACLKLDPGHPNARIGYAELLLRNGRYEEALENVNLALKNDFYNPHANFIAGAVYQSLNQPIDALEAMGWAARSMEFRSAAYAAMAEIQLGLKNWELGENYAKKALDFNKHNIMAYQALSVAYRMIGLIPKARESVSDILEIDPLNHFARFEQYLIDPDQKNLEDFNSLIRNEQPFQTYLEIAADYLRFDRHKEAEKVLMHSPQHPLVNLWLAYLSRSNEENSLQHLSKVVDKPIDLVFPFRAETLEALEWANTVMDHWKLRYYLALNLGAMGRTDKSAEILQSSGETPDAATFYLARAAILKDTPGFDPGKDLEKAIDLDENQWRSWHLLNQHLEKQGAYEEQLNLAAQAQQKFEGNYVIEMDYVQALFNNKKYSQSMEILDQVKVLPHEGASQGRRIYEMVYLKSAMDDIRDKNFSEANEKLIKSLDWPENLGVGKPFEVDNSKQNFLLAYIASKTDNTAARKKYLQNLIEPPLNLNTTLRSNTVLKLKAMQIMGLQDEFVSALDTIKQSGHKLSDWTVDQFESSKDLKKTKDGELMLIEEILDVTADFSVQTQ